MDGVLLLAVLLAAAFTAITLVWMRKRSSRRAATMIEQRVWVTAQHINALADAAMAALRDEILRRPS